MLSESVTNDINDNFFNNPYLDYNLLEFTPFTFSPIRYVKTVYLYN